MLIGDIVTSPTMEFLGEIRFRLCCEPEERLLALAKRVLRTGVDSLPMGFGEPAKEAVRDGGNREAGSSTRDIGTTRVAVVGGMFDCDGVIGEPSGWIDEVLLEIAVRLPLERVTGDRGLESLDSQTESNC